MTADRLNAVCDLTRSCGRTLREIDRESLRIDVKSGKANFVTEYDRQIQERLRAGLRAIAPEAGFVGEESSETSYSSKGSNWIVDPIDGTTPLRRVTFRPGDRKRHFG